MQDDGRCTVISWREVGRHPENLPLSLPTKFSHIGAAPMSTRSDAVQCCAGGFAQLSMGLRRHCRDLPTQSSDAHCSGAATSQGRSPLPGQLLNAAGKAVRPGSALLWDSAPALRQDEAREERQEYSGCCRDSRGSWPLLLLQTLPVLPGVQWCGHTPTSTA